VPATPAVVVVRRFRSSGRGGSNASTEIKCIAQDEKDVPCINCKQSKLECTYNQSPKKRGPPKGAVSACPPAVLEYCNRLH
jgi:hypothetical protein